MSQNSSDGDAVVDRPIETESDSADRAADPGSAEQRELAASVELLAEENRRLRNQYALVRQSRYRRTAVGLAGIGTLAALGGLVFPDGRDVLFVLAATGLFAGVITYFLTPGQFVAAEVGERVFAAAAANYAAIVDDLGLRDDRRYVPTGEPERARLFVPRHADADLPEELTRPFVADPDQRGLVLEPTGAGLFREFDRTLATELASSPGPLADQLSDGLVNGFELARSVKTDVDAASGRATVAISDSAFGRVDRFDHPIASFCAVGFAVALDRPVTLEVVSSDDGEEWLVTCRWDPGSDRDSAGSH